jgi:hypothetical protein
MEYVASNDIFNFKVHYELQRTGKEGTTVQSRYYRHLPGGTKENHEEFDSR